MITARLGIYNKKEAEVLLDAFLKALEEVEDDCDHICKDCPRKVPCDDIYRVCEFLDTKIDDMK